MGKAKPQPSKFLPILTRIFEEVEPKFREQQIVSYKAQASSQLEWVLSWLDGPEPDGKTKTWHDFSIPRYVNVAGGAWYRGWDALQRIRKEGGFRAAFERAEADANRSVDAAKAHFITKQCKKLDNATKNHPGESQVSGFLRLDGSGIIAGRLKVEYKNGDEFTLNMSVIVNYRHARGFTSFYQFPARFTRVKLNGEFVKARLSEGWMEDNFRCDS